MQYSREVEEMVCVMKGPNHGPAPIPEEGKWIQAKEIKDISGAALVDCCEMYEESGFYEENRSFFEHLRAGEKPQNDLPSGIQGVEIADCIRKRITVYKK